MTKEVLWEYRKIVKELEEMEKTVGFVQSEGYILEEDIKILYQVKRKRLTAQITEIEQAIEKLGPTERSLMRLRYIEGLEWHEICRRIHYSWQQTHRIHKNALLKLRD